MKDEMIVFLFRSENTTVQFALTREESDDACNESPLTPDTTNFRTHTHTHTHTQPRGFWLGLVFLFVAPSLAGLQQT